MTNQTRQTSVRDMFNKYELEPAHAEQVTKLALTIFDKTTGIIHKMSDNERELLEAGALLHDIGYFIGAKGHNKNAHKLITQDRLEGFNDREIEIIANIARYHRGKLPNKKHTSYMSLTNDEKQIVNRLSAFVRLADALDRTHCNVVNDIDFQLDSMFRILNLKLNLNTPSYYFEICKANEKKDLFEKEFNLDLRFITA